MRDLVKDLLQVACWIWIAVQVGLATHDHRNGIAAFLALWVLTPDQK